jgi:hypothetical protein
MGLPVGLLLLARYASGVMGRQLATQVSADPDSAVSRAGKRFMPASDRRLLDDPESRRRFDEDFREVPKQGPGASMHDLALGGGRSAPTGTTAHGFGVNLMPVQPEDGLGERSECL